MLSDEVLAEAGFWLYCSEYADEFERHGGRFPAGSEITEEVKRLDDSQYIPIMRQYVDKISNVWGRDVDVVFDLMGLGEGDYSDALYYVLMSCRGHGVGLADNNSKGLDRYYELVGEELNCSPFHTELREFADLAWENLEIPLKQWAVFSGDRVVEGKFWSEKSADDYLKDYFYGGNYHVKLVN